RNPVKHDPGAYHVEDSCVPSESEQPCALKHMRFVIDWKRGAKLRHDFAEAQKLITRVIRILTGHWQMSRNAVNPDIWKCGDLFENVQGFAFWNPHAAHARIDLGPATITLLHFGMVMCGSRK